MAKLSLKDVSNDVQYQVVAARRQNYDNLLWQTPVISLTGQAFLFTIALGSGSKLSRIIASLLALIAALASSQPLARHRHFEVYYSKLLESVELEISSRRCMSDHLRSEERPVGHRMWCGRWSSGSSRWRR